MALAAHHYPPSPTSPAGYKYSSEMDSPPISPYAARHQPQGSQVTLPSIHSILTPPDSGGTGKLRDSFSSTSSNDGRYDPHMYSASVSDASSVVSGSPIFTSHPHTPVSEYSMDADSRVEHEERQAINRYMAEQAPTWERLGLSPTSDDEYRLVASFFREYPHTFEMTWQRWNGYSWVRTDLPRHHGGVMQEAAGKPRSRPSKPSSKPAKVDKASSGQQKPRKQRQSSSASSSKTSQSSDKENTKSARAKSTKPAADTNYHNYPDYAPGWETMENVRDAVRNVKRFSGGYNNLTNDPDRHEMHPAEVEVAQLLSLNGSKYLCTKRQIFQAYVEHLKTVQLLRRRGEVKVPSWNKTEAQRKSNVDVNKASQLWQFYDSVGWFREHHFRKFLVD